MSTHANPANAFGGLTARQNLSGIKLGKSKVPPKVYFRVETRSGNLRVADLSDALTYKQRGFVVSRVTIERL